MLNAIEGGINMKASEVIACLQTLIDKHGDLAVGFRNMERFCFESVNLIRFKISEEIHGHNWDDEELGDQFISIDN